MQGEAGQGGRIVGGRFRLIREIARGGAGVIHEAEHTWTRRRMAVKLLAPELAASAEARERFLREARMAARLLHPNAISVLDVGDDHGSLFIVQELLEGEDLRARLLREGALHPGEAGRVLLPIMSALAAAHAIGIVHRDVSPSNVFLAREGGVLRPKLIDFGLSRPVEPETKLTMAGLMMGTPHYMSPEHFFEPEHVTARSDLWSIAAVWYETLAGRVPYDGQSLIELATRVRTSRPPPLESFALVSAALARTIERGLEADPDARWPSVSDFARAIDLTLGEDRPDTGDRALPASIEIDLDTEELGADEPAAQPDLGSTIPDGSRSGRGGTPDEALFRGPVLRAALLHGMRTLRVGVVPTSVDLAEPDVARALAAAVGMPAVVLRFAAYEELLEALRARQIDAAWMAPIVFLRAREAGLARGGVIAMRAGRESYVSVLIAARDRVAALDAASLDGKRAVWVDAWSAAGYVAPRRMLRARGIDPSSTFLWQAMVGSYGAIVDCLEADTGDVGAVFGVREPDGTIRFAGADRPHVRVLAASDPIPSDVLAFHADVPGALATAIVSGFVGAWVDPRARALLEVARAERFVPFEARAYDDLARALAEEPAG